MYPHEKIQITKATFKTLAVLTPESLSPELSVRVNTAANLGFISDQNILGFARNIPGSMVW